VTRWILCFSLALAACDEPDAEPDTDPVEEQCPGEPTWEVCPFVTEVERAEAQAEIDRISEIQDRHEDDVMAIEGVLSMGIGFDCPSDAFVFVVGYDEEGDCPTSVPHELDDVPVLVFPTSVGVFL